MRRLILAFSLLVAFVVPSAAQAAPQPFGHACTAQNGVRFCPTSGDAERVPTFDGIPLDVDVTLPPSGEGPFPTLVMLHGFGGNKTAFERSNPEGSGSDNQSDQMQADSEDSDDILFHYNNNFYAKQGYAVVNYSTRGFGRSCGQQKTSPTPQCNEGYIRLADSRFEVRDTQFLLGRLVDQGITDPRAMGVTGISYGGGQSIQLAKLRDKIREPDGSFSPWVSPDKKVPLAISAAYPRWPWSDLVYSLLPNGRFLDFRASELEESREPLGIPIATYISALFALGSASGYVCGEAVGSIPCTNPGADLATDLARVMAGEPPDAQARAIADEIFTFHQGFGLRPGGTAAPLLVENGWTDDLFPPHEALRLYNELRTRQPEAQISLQLGDLGHARGSNKKNTDRFFNDQGAAFFAKHFGRAGAGSARRAQAGPSAPAPGSVTAFTQTCPQAAGGGGPFQAASYGALHPGAVRLSSPPAQVVSSAGGNPATGAAIDPIAGGGNACREVADERAPGTAVYLFPASKGFTLLGRPTVTAQIQTTGDFGELNSRLWDVSPDGRQVLISRGAFRLLNNQTGRITFQLNGNGFRFAPGHRAKLELVGQDAPYLRPSNFPFSVQVSDLTVELPTAERPNGGQIVAPRTARGPAGPSLRLTVSPSRTLAGRRTRFRFRVTSGAAQAARGPARGARVRFAGRTVRTDAQGRASLTARLRRPGRFTARASRPGSRGDSASVRARRAQAPRFTG